MKQAQNARKQRARTSPRKGGSNKGGNPGNARNENRVRGNPKQLLEKYKNQAREAKQAGDRVLAEYYYQFADHYQRVLNEMRGPNDHASDQDESQGKPNGSQGADAHDSEAIAEEQQAEGNQRGRSSRGGRRNGGRNGSDDQPRVNMAEQEQPTEVHPELDLQGTVASEGEEKPRRRTSAPRRGRPRKADSAAADAVREPVPAAPQGDEAA